MSKWTHINDAASLLGLPREEAVTLLQRHKVCRRADFNGGFIGHEYDTAQVYGLKTFREFQAAARGTAGGGEGGDAG